MLLTMFDTPNVISELSFEAALKRLEEIVGRQARGDAFLFAWGAFPHG
jgi:hypothetical protein